LLKDLERETRIELATFSLGSWKSIANKEHSEFWYFILTIEITGILKDRLAELLMEFKWSSLRGQ
jgi:hypothetical protein